MGTYLFAQEEEDETHFSSLEHCQIYCFSWQKELAPCLTPNELTYRSFPNEVSLNPSDSQGASYDCPVSFSLTSYYIEDFLLPRLSLGCLWLLLCSLSLAFILKSVIPWAHLPLGATDGYLIGLKSCSVEENSCLGL